MDFISKSDFTTVGGRNNAPLMEEKKEEEMDFNVAVNNPQEQNGSQPAEKKEEEFVFDFEDKNAVAAAKSEAQNPQINMVGDLMEIFSTTNQE